MLSAGALAFGRWAGRSIAAEMRERLELRWAGLMTLPEHDRAAIVKAAMRAIYCGTRLLPLGRWKYACAKVQARGG